LNYIFPKNKLSQIKAFVFDWDGVFNDGTKNENGSSPFSEVDSMGTNLLRFSHFLATGELPFIAIITGENNATAFTLAKRESFQSVYFKIKHKINALENFCETYGLQKNEVAFFYDDVLDFSVAKEVGLRILIPHKSTPLMTDFVDRNNLVDFTTRCTGAEQGVREACEVIILNRENYDETLINRMNYSNKYQEYLSLRNKSQTEFFTVQEDKIIKAIV
jgi:3-deoxy-D-manno-octulosonate 8-phosphate phosphatase (KDO 8-P phosphatase)